MTVPCCMHCVASVKCSATSIPSAYTARDIVKLMHAGPPNVHRNAIAKEVKKILKLKPGCQRDSASGGSSSDFASDEGGGISAILLNVVQVLRDVTTAGAHWIAGVAV